ncbi:MAG TPA: bifunctional UDP-N-acetylmuramoyl-tripeptide:D-alanyl-D-alanine ligase/alanine racemase, partial [Chryseosolibacter sp.]|nr:bifunctional UDP-N-acetylmuramoyl-tripeptide:D-alanyl-D-alanine ligase/alanine racemase [Chryseosolibacter sp.]
MIHFSELPSICNGEILALEQDRRVESLMIDSRKPVSGEGVVFFAIKGVNHDGHEYLAQLHKQGIRQFVVEKKSDYEKLLPNANVLLVESAVGALQKISAHHRLQFSIPVIAITGSNGKTIVKEWLFQLLSPSYNIVKNPGSYNSQIGVPISVWQMQPRHQFAIFEAGISKPDEMVRLNQIIKPSIGIFTNIGSAHDEGFADRGEKISEKLKLFQGADIVIYRKDHEMIAAAIHESRLPALSWGYESSADIFIQDVANDMKVRFEGRERIIQIPFKDVASVENCMHCIATMLYLGFDLPTISQRISSLKSVAMRLELKEGINRCHIIDDTYNNDLAGLRISLQFLANQNQKSSKRLILSDILESGLDESELAKQIKNLVSENRISTFAGIGPVLSRNKHLFSPDASFYLTTEEFLEKFSFDELHDEVILIKGARSFAFERIVNRLQRKLHGTVMEINLGAVVHNLNYFRSLLKPETRIMVMVKAFAYGSGSTEIANLLQYHQVNYLGVAYADEGIELRKNNINLPVMVMNPTEETFESLLQHRLEPEIYSFKILDAFIRFLNGRVATIHLKLDTGMHRLGFNQHEIGSLINTLQRHPEIRVASIFSHLSGADEAVHDKFSEEQAAHFQQTADGIAEALKYKPLYHLLNSPGILRLPHLQFDMVRLGVGLYGVNPTSDDQVRLKTVATLKTVISQIRTVPKDETIGYGRRGKAENDLRVATIAIGYADGYTRAFSRGVGKVMVNGKIAPVVGNVCMDMTMIDITGIEATEGDEVVIFGESMPIENVAE